MIHLLYHATIYYEIRKFVQESEPAALMYEMVIEKAKAHERNVLEYKDHQASHGGANSAPSYNNSLLTANSLMSEGTAPHMGRPVIDAKASIILKPFVIPRLQPRRRRALTKARSHSHRDMVPQGATVARAKEVATINTRRRRCQRSCRSRKHMQ